MHDIWNPWHGCVKCSEGCEHCYMYFLDRLRDHDGREIYKTKGGFDKPLQRNRQGQYKTRSGETVRVCMTSDFFLEEVDQWREDAWDIIRQRRDVVFFLLTKRPQRVRDCLPDDWGMGGRMSFSMSHVRTSAGRMSASRSYWSCPSSIRASCAPPSSAR